MLNKLQKITGLPCELKFVNYDDKVKHELYVGGKKVGFLWESKVDSNFDDKDNVATDALIEVYLNETYVD